MAAVQGSAANNVTSSLEEKGDGFLFRQKSNRSGTRKRTKVRRRSRGRRNHSSRKFNNNNNNNNLYEIAKAAEAVGVAARFIRHATTHHFVDGHQQTRILRTSKCYEGLLKHVLQNIDKKLNQENDVAHSRPTLINQHSLEHVKRY